VIERGLGEFSKLCEIIETPEGILVKPKKTLVENQPRFQEMYRKIVGQMGGQYQLGTSQFLFPVVKPPESSIAGRERELQILSLGVLVSPSFSVRAESDDISEVVETIRTHGILEPLVVRPIEGGKFEVVIGSRRIRAAERVGLDTTLCIVVEMSDQEAMELQWVENEERKDLTDYEKGRWLKEMMQKFPETYPSMDVLARRFGYRDHGMVSLLISHYDHIEEQKKVLPSDLVTQVTKLPERVTREIQKAPKELRSKVAKVAVEKGLSARETENLVDTITVPKVSQEEAVKVVQADTKKRVEAEKKRQEALVKKLKQCYPTELVDYVAERGVTTEGDMFKTFYEIVSEMWRKLTELGLIDQILKLKEA